MGSIKQAVNDFFGVTYPAGDADAHLKATMDWLCAAQDAGNDDGVARMFHLKSGWGASYPETTGYIIPTFLDYARHTGDDRYRKRAVKMADWESAIQMQDGAVQGGTIADPPSPALFNTGQVLFGWCAVYKNLKEERHLKSLTAAADYLCDQQDDDGAWRRNLSAFCDAPVDTYAYNVRSAWALRLAGALTGNDTWINKADANLAYVLSITKGNGWTEKNCLTYPDQPLLHTIAYTFQGMLECAALAGNEPALAAVLTGNRALMENYRKQGQLYGRYDASWHPTVRWRCLTGEAQTSIVWFRLATLTGDETWAHMARRLNTDLKQTQQRTGPVSGGVKGSHPVYGAYGKYEYLNWAAKFFADALLLEAGFPDGGVSG